MSRIARFAAYAAAFEQAAASDDWSILEPFFTDDTVYDAGSDFLGPEIVQGRSAVFDSLKQSFAGFDRRFDSRELTLVDGPKEEGHSVWIDGTATYRAAGVPDFVLRLEETVHFDGGGDAARITRIEDRYSAEMLAEAKSYFAAWGAKLGLSVGSA